MSVVPPLAESTVSTTMLNIYDSCNYACKIKYVDKKYPVFIDDTPLKVGAAGHKIFEHFYENLDLNAGNIEEEFKEKLKQSAFTYWDRSIDSRKREEIEPAFFGWLKFELERYKHYKNNNKLDIFKPVEVEQDLTDYKNKIRAVVDKRCVGISGIKYVIDYKFYKKKPAQRNYSNILSQIDLKYKVQAALNAMVLESYGYHIDGFYYHFVRYPETMLSVPLIPELFIEIKILINKLRTDTQFEKNKKSCFLCNFKMHCNLKETSINCL